MWRRIAVSAALTCAATAAPASAAVVTLRTECTGQKGCSPATVVAYDAAAGELNDIAVGHADGRFIFRDRVSIAASRGCKRLSEREVACGGYRAEVRLGDGSDLLRAVPKGKYGAALRVDAGPGNDRLDGPRAQLQGGEGDDELTGEILDGGPGRDSLTATVEGAFLVGGADADVVRGGDGDDVLAGDLGTPSYVPDSTPRAADVLDGGRGADTLSYAGHDVPVRVDLSAQTGGSAGEGDVVTGFEHASGGEAGDVLIGDGGDNRLHGYQGSNVIAGGAGDDVLETYGSGRLDGGDGDDLMNGGREDDVLEGGPGADTLTGGSGLDSYSGGDGDDDLEVSQFAARGVRRERVWCGGGADEVEQPDRALVQPDCELVDSLPAYPRALPRGRLSFAIPRAGRFRGGRLELRLGDAKRAFAMGRLTRRRGTARVRVRIPRRVRQLEREPLPVEVRVYGHEYLEHAWVIDLPR
jgi:hypothetical protein